MTSDGKPFGIVIVDVDMRPALDRVRSSVRPGESALSGRPQGRLSRSTPTPAGIRLATGPADRLAERLPGFRKPRSAQRKALARRARPRTGSRTASRSRRSFWPAANGSRSSSRSRTPSSWRRRRAIRNSSIAVGLIAVLCAAVLALLIARSLTRPIVQLTEAVQGAARDGKAVIPVDAGGETGVLARAFAQVMEEANAKTVALEREVAEHRRTVAARDHHAERERLFSAAVESSNDAIITMSLDGTITGWNSAAERLYGYSAAEVAGKNITHPRPRRPAVRGAGHACAGSAGAKASSTTKRCACARTAVRSRSRSAFPRSRSPSGATIGISKVARDITDSNKHPAGAAATDRRACAASSRPRRI